MLHSHGRHAPAASLVILHLRVPGLMYWQHTGLTARTISKTCQHGAGAPDLISESGMCTPLAGPQGSSGDELTGQMSGLEQAAPGPAEGDDSLSLASGAASALTGPDDVSLAATGGNHCSACPAIGSVAAKQTLCGAEHRQLRCSC